MKEGTVEALMCFYSDDHNDEFNIKNVTACFVVHMQLMRLFIGEPVWTAYNRPQEEHPARQGYVKSLMESSGVAVKAH